MSSQPISPRHLKLAAAASALLVAAGAVAFSLALQHSQQKPAASTVKLSIGTQACNPNSLKVSAGKTVFEIHNESDRAVEWEILEGVMVLEERENILPGFTQTLTAQLQPGTYEMTCGLLTNPRGTIEVAAVAGAASQKAFDEKAFIGVLSEYSVMLRLGTRELQKNVGLLNEAIMAGDVERARKLYLQSRLSYARIASVMVRLSDAEAAINPVAAFLEKREEDPGFTGFHRIEYGLFAKASTEGLSAITNKLATDVAALDERLRSMKLVPADLAGNTAKLASRIAERQSVGGENIYAGSDLAEFDTELSSMAKIAELLKPMLKASGPGIIAEVDEKLGVAASTLAQHKSGDGFFASATLDEASRQAISAAFSNLSAALTKANEALGLS